MTQQNNQGTPTTIGKRIKELREKRGWNQTTAAVQLLVSTSVLSRIESGKRELTLFMLIQVCEVFHVSADYVLYGEKDTENQIDLNGLPFAQINAIKEIVNGLRRTCQIGK